MNSATQTGRDDVDAGAVEIDPMCGRADVAPYRRIIHDVIVEGCIDAFHGPALSAVEPRPSSSLAWHYRPIAVALRASMLDRMRNGWLE